MRPALNLNPSPVRKRSVTTITGHKTSISLENEFRSELKRMAQARGVSMSALVGEIDAARTCGNLSCALRLAVLNDLKAASMPKAEAA